MSSEKIGKLPVEPIANGIHRRPDSSSEWDVKPQNAVPSSPSYSNTSVCSTDKNWNVQDSNSKQLVDDWSENEASLEATIGTNCDDSKFQCGQSESDKLPEKNSDVSNHTSKGDRRNERSPSVSSTESSSSLSKKVPPLKSLKDHVIKLVRGNASKKSNPLNTTFKQSISLTEENLSTPFNGVPSFAGKQECTSRSPHEDHNYVQPKRITSEPKSIVSSSRNSFPISTGCTKLLKDSLNNAGISFTATPNTIKLPAEVAPPVTVPRSNNYPHRDVLEHLASQSVTKSWNGIVNNNIKSNSWHQNSKQYGSKLVHSREYDEFDAEVDRGRLKKRKSFDNRNYRGLNNRNQFQEFYEGNKHNNFQQPYRSNSYGGSHGRRYQHYH